MLKPPTFSLLLRFFDHNSLGISFAPIRITCPFHLILFDVNTLIDVQYKDIFVKVPTNRLTLIVLMWRIG